MRLAFGVQYQGTNYFGWQKQTSFISIQEEIESALSKVANSTIAIVGSGRTDTGVHASGQVGHFDTEIKRDNIQWLNGANRFLPKDINLSFVTNVSDKFHARFSAIKRHYRYIIYNSNIRSCCFDDISSQVYLPLDDKLMHEGAQILLGKQDFTSLRDANCQSFSPIRDIFTASVKRQGDFVVFDIKANAFLHHMVRNIMGLLVPIGLNKKPINYVREVLDAKNRAAGGMTYSPKGLYLHKIDFDPLFNFNFKPQQHIIDLFE